MMRTSPARVEDLDFLDLQPEQLLAFPDMQAQVTAQIEQSWHAITIRDDDEVLAIVGIVLLTEKHGDAWAVVAKDLKNRGFMLTKGVRYLIDWAEKHASLIRIGILVLPTCRRHLVWAKRLGFAVEGTARKIGPNGEDYLLMSRIST